MIFGWSVGQHPHCEAFVSIHIAAGLIPSGAGVPAICSRHGEQAALHKPVRFLSKPPGWAYALLLLGALPFLIAVLILRKEVRATSWPFCAKCQQLHKQRTLLGAALFLPLVLAFVLIAAAPDGPAPAVTLLMVASFFACIGGMVALTRGSYRMLPQGFVTPDGNWVEFAKAHPAFVAEGQAAYQRAMQQYAAAQASQHAAYAQQQRPQA